ncbi:MAG: bifunctional riboflavin kinase/FAD synthetase [Bacillota bacterium]|nr:bifunctional riboflavin kinase/FAD synthetase [Bacillota bacterium]
MSMDGFINLNKQPGRSSQYAVAAVKRLLHCKVGHCGTLDPRAGGVLPLCLGKATRLAEYVAGGDKLYIGELCFGVETDSYDADGARVAVHSAAHLCAADIEALLPRFCGDIMQVPPLVSALKQGGEALYKKARRGERPELAARPVHIYELQLLDFRPGDPAYATLSVRCGGGVYIRSLAHDLGAELGMGAHLSALSRRRVGQFTLDQAYTVERIAELAAAGDHSFVLPMSACLEHLPPLLVTKQQEKLRLLHGNPLLLPDDAAPCDLCRVEDGRGQLLGIGSVTNSDEGMRLEMRKVLADAKRQIQYSVCAIGNFDGVHLGHRALLERVHQLKRRLGGCSALVTFEPHPLQVILGRAPQLLNAREQKRRLLKGYYDIDSVCTYKFDRELMNLTPAQFVERIIIGDLGAKEVVVGYNFTFGAHGAGTAQTLRELCAARGVNVSVIEEISCRHDVISSSNIRRHLHEGDMRAVNEMLGYWYMMEGEVMLGNQLGRTLGFPTANLLPPEYQAAPPNGVYAVRIVHQGRVYDGVANFGVKPTIGGEIRPLVEAHLFDAQPDLYGEWIQVYFADFLRPEKRFSSLAQLSEQITADSLTARKLLRKMAAQSHLPKPLG